MKHLLRTLICVVAGQFNSWFDEAADGLEERNITKVAVNCVCIVLCSIAFVLAGLLIAVVAINNMHVLIIGVFLAAGLYSGIQKLFEDGEAVEEQTEEPTTGDYFAVLETLRPAVAEVAQVLELTPVYSHTDMAADPEEQILPWGKVWRMKYKALKKNTSTAVDTALCKRIIQAQVKTVLERDNPSGFASVRFQRGGSFVPVVQIDEIKDGDAYIYIFAVIASDQYFGQKTAWMNRSNILTIEASSDDPLFR